MTSLVAAGLETEPLRESVRGETLTVRALTKGPKGLHDPFVVLHHVM
jgi:hypothetical protein